jgi:hypothetical protein
MLSMELNFGIQSDAYDENYLCSSVCKYIMNVQVELKFQLSIQDLKMVS